MNASVERASGEISRLLIDGARAFDRTLLIGVPIATRQVPSVAFHTAPHVIASAYVTVKIKFIHAGRALQLVLVKRVNECFTCYVCSLWFCKAGSSFAIWLKFCRAHEENGNRQSGLRDVDRWQRRRRPTGTPACRQNGRPLWRRENSLCVRPLFQRAVFIPLISRWGARFAGAGRRVARDSFTLDDARPPSGPSWRNPRRTEPTLIGASLPFTATLGSV